MHKGPWRIKRIMNKVKSGQSGQVLLMAIIFMLVGGLIIGALLPFMGSGYKNTVTVYNERAGELYAADAGVRDGMWNIQHNIPWLPGVGSTVSASLQGGLNGDNVSYEITRLPNSKYSAIAYHIASQATDNANQSRLTVVTAEVTAVNFTTTIMQNAITSPGEVQQQGVGNPIDVNGVIQSPYTQLPTYPYYNYGGNFTADTSDILSWPIIASTNNAVQTYYYQEVYGLTPFTNTTIDISVAGQSGPLYVNNGNPDTTYTITGAGTLTGTIYVNGNVQFGNISGTKANITLGSGSHGYTIFVTGSVTKMYPGTGFGGPGALIANGDIQFQPSTSANNIYVLVMSLDGTVYFQPNNNFYGSVAGYDGVETSPSGSSGSLNYVPPPPGVGLDVPGGSGGQLIGSIENWKIGTSSIPLSIASPLPNGQVGVHYSAAPAYGGTPPYLLSVTGAPQWMSASGDSLYGTPTATGTYTFEATVTDATGDNVSVPVSITIAPPPPASFIVTYSANTTAGVGHDLVVTADDAAGDKITGYTGTVVITSTDTQFSLAPYTFTAGDAGTHTFLSVALKTAGLQSITATDEQYPTATGDCSVQVSPGPFDHYSVSSVNSPQTAGTPFDVTISAKDAYGNTVITGPYASENLNVTYNPSGGSPSSVTLNNGTADVSVTIPQPEASQTITFTDASSNSVTSNAFVVNAAGSQILYPAVDTYVDSAYPSTNYAGDGNLWVSKNGSELRSTFIKFDLSGLVGDNITGAMLTLYDTSGSNVVQPYRVYKSWDDNVTWNTTNGTTPWSNLQSAAGGDYGNPGPQGLATVSGTWMSINVTQDVQYFVANQNSNYGWILASAGTGNPGVSFAAAGSYTPILTVTYTP